MTSPTLASLAYLFYSLIPPNSRPPKQAPTLNLHSFDKHTTYRFSQPPPPPPPHLIYTKTTHFHQKCVFIPTTNTKPMNKAKEMSMVMCLGLQICFFFISFSFLLTKNLDTIWAIDYDNDGMAGRGSTEWRGRREYEATTCRAWDASASRARKPIFSHSHLQHQLPNHLSALNDHPIGYHLYVPWPKTTTSTHQITSKWQ